MREFHGSGLLTAGPVLESAAHSHVGMHRRVNEDAVLAREPVFVVADGMGGHEAGDLASAAAVAAFAALASSTRPLHRREVEDAIEGARRAVDEVSFRTERGAGCTLSGVVLIEHEGVPHWYVVNIGDSRVYLHTGADLRQLTVDHSLHAELLAEGRADAELTPKNVITRALGSGDSRHDAWLLPVRAGTRLLVCSDGLTTELEDEELRAVLTVGGRPDSVAQELLRRACEAGGRDNISVVVVDTISADFAALDPGGVSGSDDPRDDSGDEDTVDEDTLEVTRPVRR